MEQFPNIYRNIPRNILPLIISGLARIVLALAVIGASTAFVINNQRSDSPPLQLARTIEKTPQNINLRLQYARELEKEGKPDAAREQILAALNFDPVNPYALRFYSEFRAKSADLENEIKMTREILTKRPDYQKAWVRLATLYEYRGQTDLANEARQKAEELAKKL